MDKKIKIFQIDKILDSISWIKIFVDDNIVIDEDEIYDLAALNKAIDLFYEKYGQLEISKIVLEVSQIHHFIVKIYTTAEDK